MSQGIRHAPLITFFTPAHTPQKGKARSPYFSCIVYMDINVHVIHHFSYSLACVNMSKISCATKRKVENNGFEPLTPCLQSRCSSQLS